MAEASTFFNGFSNYDLWLKTLLLPTAYRVIIHHSSFIIHRLMCIFFFLRSTDKTKQSA